MGREFEPADDVAVETPVPLAQWEQAWREDNNVRLHLNWNFKAFERVSSTMDVARSFLPEVDESSPLLVVAAGQSQGRGRQGKHWDSERGAFLGTHVFQGAGVGSLSGLSLAMGCAVLRVVQTLLGTASPSLVGLKWPNDVMTFDERKLAGILLELVGDKDCAYSLIGTGVNLRPSDAGTSKAGSQDRVCLEDLVGARYSAVEFGRSLTAQMEDVWSEFSRHGFSAFREEWQAHSVHQGRVLRVMNGSEHVEGRYKGVSADGHLQLDVDGSVRTCVSGSVKQL